MFHLMYLKDKHNVIPNVGLPSVFWNLTTGKTPRKTGHFSQNHRFWKKLSTKFRVTIGVGYCILIKWILRAKALRMTDFL